jgi:hypothetical protein
MAVRIVREGEPRKSQDRDYVRVCTQNDPEDDTVTLATIQRIVEKNHVENSETGLHVKTLVLNQPMPSDVALGLATRYAERKHIPVVYTA